MSSENEEEDGLQLDSDIEDIFMDAIGEIQENTLKISKMNQTPAVQRADFT